MHDADLGNEERQQIDAMKRAVWSQKGAGDHYHYLAYKKDPIIRLKNLTEISFVLRNAVGPLVLDAGAGTGRFTFPLRSGGLSVFPLDLSLDMLRTGVVQGRDSSLPFPCACGDIGRLPFADATFDSVVSITVLRHFPHWRDLLKEYVRVVRPGGRLVFDMGSGDQRAYLQQLGVAAPHAQDGFHPLGYDGCVTMRELEAFAVQNGLTITYAAPHDPFNDNHLLKHLLENDLETFDKRLRELLESDDVIAFCDLLQRRFLSALGPALCSSILVVLDKVPAEAPFAPAYRGAPAVAPGCPPQEAIDSVLGHCLARRYGSYLREAGRNLDGTSIREFVDFCERDLLPRWPVDTFTYDA